jgi:hypothetical protein
MKAPFYIIHWDILRHGRFLCKEVLILGNVLF